jgi:hypothetical protein
MNSTSIHNIISLRMNVKESTIDSVTGGVHHYKVITLVSKDVDGHTNEVTFFTDSLDLDLQGSLE